MLSGIYEGIRISVKPFLRKLTCKESPRYQFFKAFLGLGLAVIGVTHKLENTSIFEEISRVEVILYDSR